MLRSIKFRVQLIFILISVLPLGGFVVWEYNQSIERLSQRSFEQLKTVRQIKKRELEWYFSKINTETGLFAQSNFAVNAMKEFKEAFAEMKDLSLSPNYKKDLQEYYEDQQIHIPTPKKGKETEIKNLIPDNTVSILLQHQYLMNTKANFEHLHYFDIHNKYHKSLSSFIKRYDIYDLFLIEDKTGYIVYSVAKEIDYATSLLSGPFADSNIGKLYRKIRYTGLKNGTMMCDFERYLPSNFAPAAFIAAPVFDGELKIGTLILQVPLHKINEIATGTKAWEEEGLGQSGETYIVGSDYKMRTDSRFIIESPKTYFESIKKAKTATQEEIALMDYYKTSVLFQKVDTEPVTKALAGISGTMITPDYRKIEVLSSYTSLKINGMSWAFLAEIDAAEVFGSVKQGARKSILMLSILVFIAFIASVILARTIYKPIRSLAKFATELGKGNFDAEVKVSNKDELGVLAETFNDTISKLKKGRQEIVTKNNLLNKQKDELAIKSLNLSKLNDQISTLNKSLDEKVKKRTLKLQEQNKQLIKYAHFNSHQLRGPVSSILGLLDLIKSGVSEEDKNQCLALLDQSTKQLDQLIQEAQELLKDVKYQDDSDIEKKI
ncbi:HAMP domain-containing protein [Aquimarina pacifica]|uniref:HAMP domain-containing protein n=1 Tax=Aquimarina pacifica TaxID=1296415 RepID=UPI000472DC5A|nr:HAMP domain-containing protein [Aquimarina pacifica]